jgi:hypothetical protein
MGILFDMKAFFRWLDEASDLELTQRRDVLLDLMKKPMSEDGRNDVRYLIRQIEGQIISRAMSK